MCAPIKPFFNIILFSEDREIVDDLNYNFYELTGCPGDQPELEAGMIVGTFKRKLYLKCYPFYMYISL